MSTKRDAEEELDAALTLAGPVFAGYERQFGYIHGRKFRADFAWPAARLLVEVQGGAWSGQAHGSITGVLADIERLNIAMLNGWRVLRFATGKTWERPYRTVRMDEWVAEVLSTIERALAAPAEASG